MIVTGPPLSLGMTTELLGMKLDADVVSIVHMEVPLPAKAVKVSVAGPTNTGGLFPKELLFYAIHPPTSSTHPKFPAILFHNDPPTVQIVWRHPMPDHSPSIICRNL